MMEHFGASVTAIQGNWFSNTSDNLAEINRRTASGMSIEEAAAYTKTGGYAKTWGFTDVEVLGQPQGAPGKYTSVHVLFKK